MSALKCYTNEAGMDKKETTCKEGVTHCWKIENTKNEKSCRGCIDDDSGCEKILNQFFKGTNNTCNKVKEYAGCTCSTDLCNQASFINGANLFLSAISLSSLIFFSY